MNRFLPKVADNNFLGPKIAFYFFLLFMVVNTVRSFIHFLAEDAGLNSVANIVIFEGDPDPNKIIYLFGALWGEMQLLLCLISWIVIFRYKSLIPLMYFIWLMEWILRATVIRSIMGWILYTLRPNAWIRLCSNCYWIVASFFIMSLKIKSE